MVVWYEGFGVVGGDMLSESFQAFLLLKYDMEIVY